MGAESSDRPKANAIPSRRSRPFPWRIAGIGAIVFALLTLLFQNSDRATVDIFWMQFSMPLWILLLAMFILGMVLGGTVLSLMKKAVSRDSRKKD